LKLLRRILVTVVITLAVIFVGVYWILPVSLSFYAARKALPVTRVVPVDLTDKSVSEASGEKLSYFGYEFEVPWGDLDETQSKLYPKNDPKKCKVALRFHSGLRVLVTAVPPREWVDGLADEMKVSPQRIHSSFGSSDYLVVKTIYEFTPERMNHWTLSPRIHAREEFLLIVKTIALLNSAKTGIFNLQNDTFKGFQEGSPQVRQDGIAVHLFSDEGSVEFLLLQKDYQNPAGVAQSEINRIVRSLRRVKQDAPTASRIAKREP
jgi:hypothetical protein